ncbi:urease accessory protein [Flavobacterium araucananum]|jgi:urease accessory protein|uniref:Urease accessory protein UreE n=1 Tax=Flavobacterium araucananum TaxID=946678 RepID=A0A227NVY5_9FLAO|nr:urease accessory protein UreE [Flavobacterium araucananum]OXG01582.1 urease accessory protein UreE [Flavobacterium araucananum]PWJ98971.1 urease accessory protein [Flavobacterium araucananum]
MLIKEIVGNTAQQSLGTLKIDVLEIEWYEATKRIQRKTSNGGTDLSIKFLREGQRLQEGDILCQDNEKAIVVHIKPCDAIVIKPETMLQMGTVCYEIGNKHMPLFIQNELVLMPFEMPMFRWLEAAGYQPAKEKHQLLNLLKSNTEPHGHSGSNSLFSKIINIASKNDQ